MTITIEERCIIPQSPEGKQFADELSGRLKLMGEFRGRQEDTVSIIILAERKFDV